MKFNPGTLLPVAPVMTAALVWIALGLAALGHGFLWSGLVNRLHAWGGPRRFIKLLTLLCGVALLAIPAAIAWHELSRSSGQGYDPFAHGDLRSAYLWLCLVIGAGSLVVKPCMLAGHALERTAAAAL